MSSRSRRAAVRVSSSRSRSKGRASQRAGCGAARVPAGSPSRQPGTAGAGERSATGGDQGSSITPARLLEIASLLCHGQVLRMSQYPPFVQQCLKRTEATLLCVPGSGGSEAIVDEALTVRVPGLVCRAQGSHDLPGGIIAGSCRWVRRETRGLRPQLCALVSVSSCCGAWCPRGALGCW